jgi:hypothetical protein
MRYRRSCRRKAATLQKGGSDAIPAKLPPQNKKAAAMP